MSKNNTTPVFPSTTTTTTSLHNSSYTVKDPDRDYPAVMVPHLYDYGWMTHPPPEEWDYPIEGFRACEFTGSPFVFMLVKPIVYTVGIVGIILTVVVLSRKTMCT
jgi:hypothetical protein